MSPANVEVVRTALDSSSGGDLETFLAVLDPAIEWIPVESDPAYRVHHGHEDVLAWLVEWTAAFPDLRWESERIVDAGGELVVALGRLTGEGQTSGAAVTSQVYGIVFTVRSGKIVRVEETDYATALQAAGLAL